MNLVELRVRCDESAPAAARHALYGVQADRCAIADLTLALTDGYTTGKGLGLGLGGAKRLSSEFAIDSKPGRGTKVTFARWR